MADNPVSYPNTVPLPPLSRPAEVAELLVGAIDLHCHSGPAAMPRILDHHDELLDAAAAGFRAVLYKDHCYPGLAHAISLEKLVPELGVLLYSGEDADGKARLRKLIEQTGYFPIDLGVLDAGGPLSSLPFGPLAGTNLIKI